MPVECQEIKKKERNGNGGEKERCDGKPDALK